MTPIPILTEHFAFDGRGPSIVRWLYHSDLLFEGTFWPDMPDGIHGAEYGIPPVFAGDRMPSNKIAVVDPHQGPRAWVVFHDLQVIQIVPQEVHSYWHLRENESGTPSGVWEVVDSDWVKCFNPRHLADQKHFILEFYDEFVEVIAHDLVFGHGEFLIDRIVGEDGRFAYAYLRRAQVRENAQEFTSEISDYRCYPAFEPDAINAAHGLRCAEALEIKVR